MHLVVNRYLHQNQDRTEGQVAELDSYLPTMANRVVVENLANLVEKSQIPNDSNREAVVADANLVEHVGSNHSMPFAENPSDYPVWVDSCTLREVVDTIVRRLYSCHS